MDAPTKHVQEKADRSLPRKDGAKPLRLDRDAAHKHLEGLAPGETVFTFQTFDDNSDRNDRSLLQILHGSFDKHAATLERLNQRGAGIFVMVNAGDGQGRKRENVTGVRALFIDTDGVPLLDKYALDPSLIVESSTGKWHVYWRVIDVPLDDFKPLQQGLAALHNTDPAVNDLPRVVRLAGTHHLKGDPVMVKIHTVSRDAAYTAKQVNAAWPDLKKPDIKKKVKAEPAAKVSSAAAPFSYVNDTPAAEIVRKKLAAQCEKVAKLPAGGRNNAVVKAAYTFAGYVASGYISDAEVRSALENAAQACGLSAAESAQAVANGLKDGQELPLELDLLEYRQTDYGSAERLWALFGNEFRYTPALGFIVWDGQRWTMDDDGRAMKRKALKAARLLSERAVKIDDDGQYNRAEWIKYALSCERAVALKNAVELVKSIPGVDVSVGDLDADQMKLNVQNGTINLRTGKLEPHNPADLITKIAPVVYDPAAKCPQWLEFQKTICAGDDDLVRYKQRAYGYTLTGKTTEHALFVMYGNGSNGKSTEIGVVAKIMGDYATAAQFDTFAVRKSEGVRNDLADLVGARFVSASEGESGQRLAEGLVKQMTGGDPIKARFLHKEFFTFQPAFKAFLATNHKPVIRGTDEGIWRRIKLVPYTVTIPPEQRDLELPAKLEREASGIFRWLLEGCLEWQNRGLGEAEAVSAATKNYRVESDALANFIDACCATDELYSEPVSKLYAAYTEYCEDNGDNPFNNTLFGKMLTERGYAVTTRRNEDGKVVRIRTGICLAKSAEGGL